MGNTKHEEMRKISKIKEADIYKDNFLRNYSRIKTGQYMIKLPLKEDPSSVSELAKKVVER